MAASNVRRLAACTIDWYISSVFASIPIFLIDFGTGKEMMTALISAGVAIVFCSLYYVGVPLIWDGKTIGKKLMKLQICRADGRKLDFYTLFKREIIGVMLLEGGVAASSGYLREMLQLCVRGNVLLPLSIASSVVTIGSVFIAVVGKEKRMLHDYVGGTVVRTAV